MDPPPQDKVVEATLALDLCLFVNSPSQNSKLQNFVSDSLYHCIAPTLSVNCFRMGPLLILSSILSLGTDSDHDHFEWLRTIDESSTEIVYRLQNQSELTDVYFSFDAREGGLLRKNYVDAKRQLLAAPPGRHLWLAHPEFLKSVEGNIEELLNETKNLSSKFPYLLRDENFSLRPFSLIEQIEAFIKTEISTPSLNELIEQTQSSVLKSRREFVPFIDGAELKWLDGIIQRLDLIEPLHSDFSESTTRIDAFVLYPMITLQKFGEEVLLALNDWAKSGPRFPLEWFVTEVKIPLEIRLALLMLITHNHTAEDLFLKGCLAEFGARAMAEAALNLNRVYGNERAFWQSKDRFRLNPQLDSLFPKSDISFLNKHRWREVNVSPKVTILPKLIGFSSHTKKNSEDWLPYTKLYHYYGAFIVALRMRRELGLSSQMTRRATSLLGHAYKFATASASTKELQLMSRFYSMGAKHALEVEFLIAKN